MRTSLRPILLLPVVFGLLLSSCGSDESGFPNGAGNGAGSIRGNASLIDGVVALDPDTEASMLASDLTTITFAGAPDAVAGLETGDVFIAQDRAWKVVSVEQQGGDTVVHTSEPLFSEVFRTLEISVENLLLSEAYRVSSPLSGAAGKVGATAVRNVSASSDGTYTIDLIDPGSILQGRIVLVKPQVTLLMNYGLPGDQYASIHFRVGESVEVGLSKDVSVSANQEIELLAFEIPVPVTWGTVSAGVALVLRLGADGMAELVAGIRQEISYDAGMKATVNPWTATVSDRTTHRFELNAPEFNGEVTAFVAVDPNIDVQLLQYSLAGLTNDLGLSATATAEGDLENVCFRLRAMAGLSSEAYVMVPTVAVETTFTWDEFFGGLDISMVRYPKELFRIDDTFYDSGVRCLVPPVADAGEDLTVQPGAEVILDGSASYDPTGEDLQAYAWTQVEGPAVTLAGADAPTASFTAPPALGAMTFRLTVMNTNGAEAEDDVVVTVAESQGVPPAPSGVTATGGNGKVTVDWNEVSGATSYNLYVAEMSGVDPTSYDRLPGGARFVDVAAPFELTGLTNGTEYFFVVTAVNEAGEGPPSAEVSATPREPSAPGQSSIAAGGLYTCVVEADGGVSCWGRNNSGQLGNGTTTPSFTPVSVSGISSARQVATGWEFSCALLTDGTVRCWGINSVGELGNGTVAGSSTPVPVTGISSAVALAAGEFHACAILEDKTIRCWGLNGNGQLGNGTFGYATTPVEVVGIDTATDVAGGGKHTCAVLEDGTVRCWGLNATGQLGNFTTPSQITPIEVLDITTATSVSAGYDYTCAVLESGGARCWGRNTGGQLGSSQVPQGQYTVHPVDVEGISSIDRMEAGHDHTCAVAGGDLFCWGNGHYWQDEEGTPMNGSLTPVQVSGVSGASAVTASGDQFTCAVAGGAVECLGLNRYGELGVDPGTSTLERLPVTVPGVAAK